MAKLISVGQLIDESWELYKERFTEFMSISGWLLIAAILEVISLAFYPSATTLAYSASLSFAEKFGVILFALTQYVVTPLLMVFIFVGLVRLIRGANVKKALTESKQLFTATLFISILVFLMIILAQVIGFAPSILLSLLYTVVHISAIITLANILLILAPFVALVLTALWLVYYIFAPFSTAFDKIKGKQALHTSRELVKGKFWSVLIRLAVPKIVFILIGVFAVSVIAYIVQIVIVGSIGLNIDLHLRVTTLTQSIIPILIAILINPLVVTADVLLYQSLKSK